MPVDGGDELFHMLGSHIWDACAASYCKGKCSNLVQADDQVARIWIRTTVGSRARVLIEVDHELKLIVVAFRGTVLKSFSSLLNNVICSATESGIHKGYYDAALAMSSVLTHELDRITSAHKNYAVIFSGHSQGGGICGAFSSLYSRRFKVLAIFTFGSVSFVRCGFPLEQFGVGQRFYRVETDLDPIPPAANPGFEHTGQKVCAPGKTNAGWKDLIQLYW
eukprot:227711_1